VKPRLPTVVRNGKRTIPDEDSRHGTEAGYAAGCREFCCRKGHADYNAQKKAERIARGIPEDVHGTPNGYNNYSCHCDACQIGMLLHGPKRRKPHA
jgi:hypothetical protein